VGSTDRKSCMHASYLSLVFTAPVSKKLAVTHSFVGTTWGGDVMHFGGKMWQMGAKFHLQYVTYGVSHETDVDRTRNHSQRHYVEIWCTYFRSHRPNAGPQSLIRNSWGLVCFGIPNFRKEMRCIYRILRNNLTESSAARGNQTR